MKQWLLVAAVLVVVGAIAVVVFLTYDSTTPRFVTPKNSANVVPAISIHYSFLSPDPFRGGKLWLSFRPLGDTNTYRTFLFDIDRRRIAGELLNAGAVSLTPDQTKLLCVRRSAPTNSWRERIARTVERLSMNHIRLKRTAPVRDDEEEFWLLDLNRHTAKWLGTLTQPKGMGSTFIPSPDGWSGYKRSLSLTAGLSQATFAFDLRRGSMERLTNSEWPAGWWDSSHMVLQKRNRDLLLLDVFSKAIHPLLLRSDAEAFLRKENVDAEFDQLGPIVRWNQRGHELYLAEVSKAHNAQEPSFIARLEGVEPRLTLIARQFEFERLGEMDVSGSYYVFSPREMGQCCNGVAVRELKTNTKHTLVPADSLQPDAWPNFYGSSVIYVRSNALWQIGLNGSNNVRLFPPP